MATKKRKGSKPEQHKEKPPAPVEAVPEEPHAAEPTGPVLPPVSTSAEELERKDPAPEPETPGEKLVHLLAGVLVVARGVGFTPSEKSLSYDLHEEANELLPWLRDVLQAKPSSEAILRPVLDRLVDYALAGNYQGIRPFRSVFRTHLLTRFLNSCRSKPGRTDRRIPRAAHALPTTPPG